MNPRRAFPSLAPAVLLFLAAVGLVLGATAAGAQEPSPSPSPAASPKNDDAFVQLGCENCHGDPAIRKQDPNYYVPATRLSDTVHADQLCTDCHLQSQGELHANPVAEIAAARSSCEKCHEDVVAKYQASSHGTEKGGPSCTACHTVHDIQPADNRGFVIYAANELCADCHDEKGSAFFRNNYHGKEANLGREDIAVCADCHTAHSVLPRTDPDSTVNTGNLIDTCGECHEGANANFSAIEIHVDADPIPSDPKLALATVYFIVILTATFGLFGWHMVLGIRHEFRKVKAGTGGHTPPTHEDEQP